MVHLPMTIINPSPQQNRMDILHFADECWWFAFGTWWVSDLPTSTTEGPKRFRADQWPTWPALSHPNLLRTNGKEFPALVGWHCWHCLLLSCYLCAAGLLSAHSHDTSRSRTVPSSAIAHEISHDLFYARLLFSWFATKTHFSKEKTVDHHVEDKQCSAIHAWIQKGRVRDLRAYVGPRNGGVQKVFKCVQYEQGMGL